MFFTSDFFPSPQPVIDHILSGIDVQNKIILEPSAGSGNLVIAIQQAGAKEVLGCENDPQLVKIVQTHCRILEKDFLNLTSDKISHIDAIVMNPPFSKGAEHILHAYKIAPAGCKIVALCNYETIKNPWSKTREELKTLVETYGQFQDLGAAFSTAERKTDVQVCLIRLDKPTDNYKQEFEGFFTDEDPEEQQANGLMSYNAVRDLVNRYVESIKIYDQQLETAVKLNEMAADYFDSNKQNLSVAITRGGVAVARNEFKKSMQRDGWRWIFQQMNLTKHTTRGLTEDINKFVETQDNVPFTMRNIYKMLEIVIATTAQRMDKAIIEAFDRVTGHHAENRHHLKGWKTNSHYLVCKKFILPGMISPAKEYGYTSGHYTSLKNSWDGTIPDMEKALCYITGTNYEEIQTVNGSIDRNNYGSWYESNFFKYKGYKNGNMHFEFKSEEVWANFNQRVAKIKGYPLPEKKDQTKYQERQNGRKPQQPAYKPTAQKPTILATFNI